MQANIMIFKATMLMAAMCRGIPAGDDSDALAAMQNLIDDLKSAETIAYETVDGEIIYGTTRSDTLDGTTGADIIGKAVMVQ